jgi:hypothetical protein
MAGQPDPLMSTPHLRPPVAAGAVHPVVLDRRIRDLLLIGASALVPAVIALGVTVALPEASILFVLAVLLAAIAIVAMMVSSRLEVTVLVLGLYLGLLDGPVKLFGGARELTGAVRNVLVLAVCFGALMRLIVRRERFALPPLSGWVLAFLATVLIEAFNPSTHGILKVIGGFRQQAQWVPFFFFGYLLMRSKKRFRQLFLVVGVIGLANGVVATYQTGLGPAQLASWGPGYRELYQPTTVGVKGSAARTYASEGEARVRPVGLGADSGFSGGVGVIALPFSLALLATWRSRRRWVAVVLALGAIVAVVTGLGRIEVVGAGLGAIAFAGLASLGGRRVSRAMGAALTVVIVAVPLGVVFVSAEGAGTFKRYANIAPAQVVQTSTSHKEGAWKKIPHQLSIAPFGVGLSSVGASAGLGGVNTELLEGHGVSADTQYNFIADELGAPGLLVWILMSIYVIALVAFGMRRVKDGELAIILAGAFAPFIALTLEGFSGPFLTSAAAGPYFWFTVGVVAYWFAGPGREARSADTAFADA